MPIPFVIGIVLSLVVAVFARRAGLDRDRAFYPTVLIVIASYYVLFAAIGGAPAAVVLIESIVLIDFAIVAVMGIDANPWILIVALAGHGLFDAVHGTAIENPGVPAWWPSFCGAYDVGAALWLALIVLWRGAPRSAAAVRSAPPCAPQCEPTPVHGSHRAWHAAP